MSRCSITLGLYLLDAKPIELPFRHLHLRQVQVLTYTVVTITELMENKMPPRKRTRKVVPQQAGNNSAIAGGRGAKAVISQAETTAQLRKWRKNMEKWIDAQQDLLPADKTELKDNVAKVAEEVSKGKQADSGRLERLLNVILSIAPDIFDVAITTLANPLAGLGLVAKKIGERARVEWQTAS
jgi:hypothetical protein